MSADSITFLDSNSTLIYQPTDAWRDSFFTSPTSNIAAGSLHLTTTALASVTFTFPVPAFAFSIWAIKHSNGGNYSLCYNCNSPGATIVTIDGYDPHENGHNTPVQIYSTSFHEPSTLTVVLTNTQDSRGSPVGNSQLTIANFVLNTTQSSTSLAAATVSTSIRSTATARSSDSFSSSITQFSSNITFSASSTTPSTTPGPSTTSPTSISPSSPLPIPPSSTTIAINNSSNAQPSNTRISPGVMAAVGIAAALLLIIALVFLLRWRRRRHSRPAPSDSAAAHPYYSRWGMGAEGAGMHERVSKGAPPDVRLRAPRSHADEEEGAGGKFATPSVVRRGKAAAAAAAMAPGSSGAGESSSCLLPASDPVSVGRGGGSGVGDGDVQAQGGDHAGLGVGGAGALGRVELLPPHYGDVFE